MLKHIRKTASQKSFGRSAVVLLAFFFIGIQSASAATVRGLLLHQNDARAAGFAVRVTNSNLGPSGFAYSGNDGFYYLKQIPAGDYVLEVFISNENVLRYPIRVREPLTDFPLIKVP